MLMIVSLSRPRKRGHDGPRLARVHTKSPPRECVGGFVRGRVSQEAFFAAFAAAFFARFFLSAMSFFVGCTGISEAFTVA